MPIQRPLAASYRQAPEHCAQPWSGSGRRAAGSGQQAGHGGVDRASLMELYEGRLKEARLWARIIACFYAVSRFLAYCNLTWAMVALLGSFLPKLLLRDFAFVICLIFVEAGRLVSVSASAFTRLFKRLLAYAPSQAPKLPNHIEQHVALSHRARFYSNVLQVILIAPSFLLPSLGHRYLNYGSGTNVRNLQMSLCIFYTSVAINAVMALFYLLCSLFSFMALSKTSEQSVVRYFDTVLEIAMNSTLVQADDFEFLQFAYTLLGSEFRRNVEPDAVAENHTMMIQYMYAHRLGVDFLESYLDDRDTFVQLAAVNMVGFWADKTWKVGGPLELRLPKGVLTKLADKVSTTGQVGWAAITSFGMLGASSPKGAHVVATTRTSSEIHLPARLAELVDTSISSSLSLVRTLVGFYEQLCVDVKKPPKPFGAEAEAMLVTKLELLARGTEEQSIRVQAAYLLLLMGEGWKEEVVLGIEPGKDIYWFESELMMLELLRSHIRRALLPLQLPFLYQDAPITPPAWAVPPRAYPILTLLHNPYPYPPPL